MILFFKGRNNNLFAVETHQQLVTEEIERLSWLFSEAVFLPLQELRGKFVGPRKEMITPWSTNAVEITQNMGLER
jgi:phosphoribosylformylglycinamidine synthase